MVRGTRSVCLVQTGSRLVLSALALGLILGVQVGTRAAEAEKRAVPPTDAEQKKALKTLREVYAADYSEAAASADKVGLAKKLLEKAELAENEPAIRFVLLSQVRDFVLDAGEVEVMLQAVSMLATQYRIDGVQMKYDCLMKMRKLVTTPTRRTAVAESAMRLIDEAVVHEQFDLASRLSDLANITALQVKDFDLKKKIVARRKFIKESQERYAAVTKALALLEEIPLDPQANLVVGRYRCLVQGKWESGLPMLALGSDEALRGLALQELQGVDSADLQSRLADQWWDLAENEEGIAKRNLRLQAGIWYQKALPGLEGVSKEKVEKRLQSVPGLPARKGEVAAGKWTDVLSDIDPKKHSVHGEWRHIGTDLVCDPSPKSLLMVPVAPSGNYELKLRFKRATGTSEVGLVLPVGSRSCFVILGTGGGKQSGIGQIDGKWDKDNPTRTTTVALVNDQQYELEVQVKCGNESASVVVLLDGKPHLRWQGQTRLLSVGEDFKLPEAALGLWSRDGRFHFLEMKLRMTSGSARKLQ